MKPSACRNRNDRYALDFGSPVDTTISSSCAGCSIPASTSSTRAARIGPSAAFGLDWTNTGSPNGSSHMLRFDHMTAPVLLDDRCPRRRRPAGWTDSSGIGPPPDEPQERPAWRAAAGALISHEDRWAKASPDRDTTDTELRHHRRVEATVSEAIRSRVDPRRIGPPMSLDRATGSTNTLDLLDEVQQL